MTVKHNCSAKIPDMYGVPNILSCARSATVEHNGRWYCWQHDPKRVKADAEKQLTVRQAKWDRLAAIRARRARNARLAELVTPELANLLILLAGVADLRRWQDTSTTEDVRDARALAAKIREALDEHRGT